MNRNYIILQTTSGGMGIVKMQNTGLICAVTVDINGFKPLTENEIFKTYILADKIICAGAMDSGREVFNIKNCGSIEAAAVTRKSENSEVIEFWGGNKIICDLLGEIINPKTNYETVQETADEEICDEPEKLEETEILEEYEMIEEPEKPEADCDEPFVQEENEQQEKPEYNPKCELPEKFTFENYFGGGFAWNKINGYYCVQNKKIVQYLMSVENVYESINKFGFYYFGEKSDECATYFAFAVPVDENRIIPFNISPEFVYKLEDGEQMYYVVCVGCDDSGEFFVGLEE